MEQQDIRSRCEHLAIVKTGWWVYGSSFYYSVYFVDDIVFIKKKILSSGYILISFFTCIMSWSLKSTVLTLQWETTPGHTLFLHLACCTTFPGDLHSSWSSLESKMGSREQQPYQYLCTLMQWKIHKFSTKHKLTLVISLSKLSWSY